MSTWAKIKSFLLENQSVRQTVAKNTFWMVASQFAGRLLRAGAVVAGARILGVESWGAFSYALGLAAFLTIFSDIGIAGLIIRESSRHPELREKYISTAIFIKTLLMAFGIGLFLYFSKLFTNNKEALGLFPIIALLTALDSFRDLGTSVARSLEKIEVEARVNVATNIAIVILTLAFLYLKPTSQSLAIAYVLGSATGLLMVLRALKEYFSHLAKNFTASLIKPILVSAWPLGLMSLMGAIMINTDLVMIGSLRSIADVGLYSAAQRPIQLFYILPGLLAVPLFPVMSRLANDKERLKAIFEKALALVFIIALPITMAGVLLGKEIMLLLYGSEYALGASSFQILILTMITSFPAVILGNAVFATNNERRLIIYTILGVMGNFLLNLALIPGYGLVGSAWSTVITQVISNGYLWIKMRTYFRKSLSARILKILGATLVMGGFLLLISWLKWPVLVAAALGALVYFASLFFFKDAVFEDLRSVFR